MMSGSMPMDEDEYVEYEGTAEQDMSIEQLRQRNSDHWFKVHPEVKRNGQQGQKINRDIDNVLDEWYLESEG